VHLENSFDVAAPVEAAWRLLNDIPVVVPCMPGAELVDVVADDAWKARLRVKLGPMTLEFLADVTREHVDEAAGVVVLAVKARESRGRGGADARIESGVSAAGAQTRVDLVTELVLRGAVAQYGRSVVSDVASRLTSQFADCIEQRLVADQSSGDRPSEREDAVVESRESETKPIGGLGLLLGAAWRSLRRRVHRH
jgi:carbon monoxide dehydrogenase subunit G